jgi:dephospho-CoA kinase
VRRKRRPLTVAVTGGLGSGKSTLCRLLAERGLKVIDADQVARDVVAPGSPWLDELARSFGSEILDADGRLDRAALAARALADPAGQARLHAILHPPIREKLQAEVERLGEEGTPAVVIEAALALEGGQASFYDLVVVVVAPDAEKIRRAVARGMSAEEAERRLRLLWPDAEKMARADRVIHNDGSLPALAAAADELARDIRAAAADAPGMEGREAAD